MEISAEGFDRRGAPANSGEVAEARGERERRAGGGGCCGRCEPERSGFGEVGTGIKLLVRGKGPGRSRGRRTRLVFWRGDPPEDERSRFVVRKFAVWS